MQSLFGVFKKDEKRRDLKKDEVKTHAKTSLVKSCQICNVQAAEQITYGWDVEQVLTCKRCELKAVGNDPSKLASNLIIIDKFTEVLAKQVTAYNAEKLGPNNQVRANSNLVVDSVKASESQIVEIKQAYKQLQAKTQQKLGQLISTSTRCNSVPIFDTVTKLSSDKKLDTLNGAMLAKEVIVKDGVHFFDSEEIQKGNVKTSSRIEQSIVTTELDLEPLQELIRFIDRINF